MSHVPWEVQDHSGGGNSRQDYPRQDHSSHERAGQLHSGQPARSAPAHSTPRHSVQQQSAQPPGRTTPTRSPAAADSRPRIADVEAEVRAIAAAVDTLNPASTLDTAAQIGRRFFALREQYRLDPRTVAPYASHLSILRRRFDDWLAGRLLAVVDQYQRVFDHARRAEEEKAVWREVLIRLSARVNQPVLTGNNAVIEIKAAATRRMPPATSPQRAELEKLLRQVGLWDRVSQLSGPKLTQVLRGGGVQGPAREALSRLCPESLTHTVCCRPND